MATVSFHIAVLLEKMASHDKDFRFMATNDLMSELQKDSIKLDEDSERKVVKMLLKLLEDKNGEVQNLAVKCLGPLINKVKEYQVETIVDSLCNNMLSDKEQLRDISSIGLKTVINELPLVPSTLASSICERITGRLSNAITKEDISVQLEALDILGDLLSRFGGLLIIFHNEILDVLVSQLSSPRLAVRKSRQSGHRFGEHLERILPLVVQYCEIDDDELREHCLQALEFFVRRCPKEVSNHLNTIVEICLIYICHDPNYNYYDDYMDEDHKMDVIEDEEEESQEEYSDDDDMSWKVRRASAKCLEAVISTRHEMIISFYHKVSSNLIDRFKEREENVKSDIFHAYIALLRQTRPVANLFDANLMEQSDTPVHLLQQQVPNIVSAICPQMKEKSVKTRQGCLALLTELVNVLHGALTDHISMLIPGIQEKNSTSNMKIDTLVFIYNLLCTHPPTVFHPHIEVLLPIIITAIRDPFYKITSEALLVTQQLIHVIRPLDQTYKFNFIPYVQDIYLATFMRLQAADIDQEVKERAISCMGQVLANLGDHLQNELSICLPVLLERLKNEITRLTTVRALTKIASSPLHLNLTLIMPEAVTILATFLRKNQRSLKLSSLFLLDVLVHNYSYCLTPNDIEKVIVELPPLLNESDLHITQLTLTLLTSLAVSHKESLQNIHEGILPEIQNLLLSPLLQGAALQAMLEFFKALVRTELPGLGFHDLLNILTTQIFNRSASNIVHKQAFYSLAKCVASLLSCCEANETESVVLQFAKNIENPSSDAECLYSLLAIGEIGREMDLSGLPHLQQVILNSFSASSEEIKSAASYALGGISVGNLKAFVPVVLHCIQTQPKKQYLLLHSLKEIICSQSCTPQAISQLKPLVMDIWQQLFHHCQCSEEGTRNVVAECLGKLTLIDPSNLLVKLKESLASDSPLLRTTVVTAIKFTISDQPQPIDSLLKLYIGDFLNVLQDSDINVRRVALIALNSAAHNKPSLIRDLLPNLLPHLYQETKVKKTLIREVEMGPFKHTVDDGLDIRKAGFECMYTLLDCCLDRLDVFEFLNHLEDGLKDHYDIKMLTYLMLVRLASLCPSAVLQKLDRVIDPLRATVTTKVKANAVKQEFEKQDELKRSALRAVAALLAMPDADKHPGLQDFIIQIKQSAELESLYESIQKDTSYGIASETQDMDLN